MKYTPFILAVFLGIIIAFVIIVGVKNPELDSADEFNILTFTGIIYFLHFHPLEFQLILLSPITIILILKIFKRNVFLWKTTILLVIIIFYFFYKYSYYLTPF
ncbi:hypothetical protein MASR1M45_25360 [Candidatus Kapaibacterium sp.]